MVIRSDDEAKESKVASSPKRVSVSFCSDSEEFVAVRSTNEQHTLRRFQVNVNYYSYGFI